MVALRGLAPFGDGSLEISGGPRCQAEVVARPDEVGIETQRLLVGDDRVAVPTHRAQEAPIGALSLRLFDRHRDPLPERRLLHGPALRPSRREGALRALADIA